MAVLISQPTVAMVPVGRFVPIHQQEHHEKHHHRAETALSSLTFLPRESVYNRGRKGGGGGESESWCGKNNLRNADRE